MFVWCEPFPHTHPDYWQPRFLIRSEGSTIYGGDDWVIESATVQGHFLHASRHAYDTLSATSAAAAARESGALNNGGEEMLEINCAVTPTSFNAFKWAQVTATEAQELSTLDKFQV